MTLAIAESEADWYDSLVLDIKKMEFTGIVITKWNQGKRILQDELKFAKPEYGSRTIANLAGDLKASASDVYHCIQFAREYDLQLSNVIRKFDGLSWYHVVHEILSRHRKHETPPFPAGSFDIIYADPP